MKPKTALLNLRRWTHGKHVLMRCNIKPTEHNLRKLRRMAEQSDGEVLSGDGGYRATRHATPEDIRHFQDRLMHQAETMIKRVGQTLDTWCKKS